MQKERSESQKEKGRRVFAAWKAKTTTEEYKQRGISKKWGKDKNALLEELLHLQDEASSGDVGADAHNHDEDNEEQVMEHDGGGGLRLGVLVVVDNVHEGGEQLGRDDGGERAE